MDFDTNSICSNMQQQMSQLSYIIVCDFWWLIIMPALLLTIKFLESEHLNPYTVDCLSDPSLNKCKLIKCIGVSFIELLLCQVFNLFMFYITIVRVLGLSWSYTISYTIIVSLIWLAIMIQSLMVSQSRYIKFIYKEKHCMKDNLHSAIWKGIEIDNSTLWKRLKNIWNNVSTEQIEFNFYEDKEIFNLFIEKVMVYLHKMGKSDLFPGMFANRVFEILKDLNNLYTVITKDEFKSRIEDTSVIIKRMYSIIEDSESNISRKIKGYEDSLKEQVAEKQKIIKDEKLQGYDDKLKSSSEFIDYFEKHNSSKEI